MDRSNKIKYDEFWEYSSGQRDISQKIAFELVRSLEQYYKENLPNRIDIDSRVSLYREVNRYKRLIEDYTSGNLVFKDINNSDDIPEKKGATKIIFDKLDSLQDKSFYIREKNTKVATYNEIRKFHNLINGYLRGEVLRKNEQGIKAESQFPYKVKPKEEYIDYETYAAAMEAAGNTQRIVQTKHLNGETVKAARETQGGGHEEFGL